MAIVRWSDPFREFAQLQDRINRVFSESYGRGDDALMTSGSWVPPVDIFQNGDHEMVLKAELPDTRREDIDITVDNGTLTIKGQKRLSDEVQGGTVPPHGAALRGVQPELLAAADRGHGQSGRRLQGRRAHGEAADAGRSETAPDQGRRGGVNANRWGCLRAGTAWGVSAIPAHVLLSIPVMDDPIEQPDQSDPGAEGLEAPADPAPPISSRFLFVDVAALRAKQLRRGARVRFQADQAPMPLKPERVAMEEVRRRLVQYSVPLWRHGTRVIETDA